jgi:hypothetical protein
LVGSLFCKEVGREPAQRIRNAEGRSGGERLFALFIIPTKKINYRDLSHAINYFFIGK